MSVELFPRSTSAFVGRRAEIDRALALLENEPLLAIVGVPGIGKTELVYRLVEEARSAGPWANATPLLIVVQPGSSAQDVWSALADKLGCEASSDDVATQLDAKPHLVVIDDAHHLGDDAAGLIAAFARYVRASRAVVATRHRLAAPLGAPPATVALGPLALDDIAELARGIATRRGTTPADVSAIAAVSGGSPGRIVAPEAPDPIRSALAELPAEQRRLLGITALLGRGPTAQHLCDAAGVDAASVHDALVALSDRFFIEVERGSVSVPAPVRVALSATGELDELRTPAIETSRIYALLRASRPADARAALVDAPEPVDDADRAPRLRLQAAIALRLGELDVARAAADRLSDIDDDARVAATIIRANIASLRADNEGARQLLASTESGDAALPPRLAAERDLAYALSYFTEERFAEAVAAAHQAARRFSRSGGANDITAAVGALDLIARIENDDVGGAQSLLQVATQQAHAGDDEPLIALLDGLVRCASGDMRGARNVLERARRHFEGQRDALFGSIASELLGRALLALGATETATEILAHAAAIAEAAGFRRLALRCRINHAYAAIATGKVAIARRRLAPVVDDPLLTDVGLAAARHTMGLALAIQGQLEAARALIDEPAKGSTSAQRATADLARAEIEAFDGDHAVGIDAARRARHHYRDCGRGFAECRAALALAGHYVARGGDTAIVGAEKELARAKQAIDEHGYELLRLRAAAIEAGLARRGGDLDRVRQCLMAGLRDAGTVGGAHIEVQLLRAALDAGGGDVLPGIRAIVGYLRLASGGVYELTDRGGARVISESDLARERAKRELLVDVGAGTIVAAGNEDDKRRPTIASVLARIISARTQGVSAEALYCDVWGAREYQPLKHRNTVYVTLNRVRKALEELMPGRDVIEKIPGGWRIAEDVDACAVRPLDGALDS